jgi:ribosomal protein L40E
MSGLTKKAVYADKIIATILGVKEGEHVSYSELSKGLHNYIKENNLKKPRIEDVGLPGAPLERAQLIEPATTAVTTIVTKKCRDCGADIPSDAVFCDLCGVRQ